MYLDKYSTQACARMALLLVDAVRGDRYLGMTTTMTQIPVPTARTTVGPSLSPHGHRRGRGSHRGRASSPWGGSELPLAGCCLSPEFVPCFCHLVSYHFRNTPQIYEKESENKCFFPFFFKNSLQICL